MTWTGQCFWCVATVVALRSLYFSAALFEPIRGTAEAWVELYGWRHWLGRVLSCPHCLTIWLAIGVTLTCWGPTLHWPLNAVLVGQISHGTAQLLPRLLFLLPATPGAPRDQTPTGPDRPTGT